MNKIEAQEWRSTPTGNLARIDGQWYSVNGTPETGVSDIRFRVPDPEPLCLAAAPTGQYSKPTRLNMTSDIRPRKYRPRRAAARWLEGAPSHVIDVFANQYGYTILYWFLGDTFVGGRHMNSIPRHPQFGVATSIEMEFHEVTLFRYAARRRRMRWADLPADVRRVAFSDAITVL